MRLNDQTVSVDCRMSNVDCLSNYSPKHLAEMDGEEHAKALEKFGRRHLHFFYLGFTQRFNLAHFEVLDSCTDCTDSCC